MESVLLRQIKIETVICYYYFGARRDSASISIFLFKLFNLGLRHNIPNWIRFLVDSYFFVLDLFHGTKRMHSTGVGFKFVCFGILPSLLLKLFFVTLANLWWKHVLALSLTLDGLSLVWSGAKFHLCRTANANSLLPMFVWWFDRTYLDLLFTSFEVA